MTSPSVDPKANAGSTAAPTNTAKPIRTQSGSSLGELFSKLSDQVHTLVQGEIDLAKAKATVLAKKCGTGGALLAVAGVLALYMLGILLWAAIYGIGVALPMWASCLIVAGVLLVIILILALVGLSQLKKGTKDKPDPQKGFKQSIDAAKTGAQKGLGK